jgi:hypothetical protein
LAVTTLASSSFTCASSRLNCAFASSITAWLTKAAGKEFLLARHVRRRQLAHGARLLQLLGGGRDFRCPLAGLQFATRASDARKPLQGFAARRPPRSPRSSENSGRGRATSSPRLTESCRSVPANGAATRTYSPST